LELCDESGYLVGGVGPIGVENNNCVMLGGKNSSFDRRSVASVFRVAQNPGPSLEGLLRCPIPRAIVNDEDLVPNPMGA
jgi:hypothetical protein